MQAFLESLVTIPPHLFKICVAWQEREDDRAQVRRGRRLTELVDGADHGRGDVCQGVAKTFRADWREGDGGQLTCLGFGQAELDQRYQALKRYYIF